MLLWSTLLQLTDGILCDMSIVQVVQVLCIWVLWDADLYVSTQHIRGCPFLIGPCIPAVSLTHGNGIPIAFMLLLRALRSLSEAESCCMHRSHKLFPKQNTPCPIDCSVCIGVELHPSLLYRAPRVDCHSGQTSWQGVGLGIGTCHLCSHDLDQMPAHGMMVVSGEQQIRLCRCSLQ